MSEQTDPVAPKATRAARSDTAAPERDPDKFFFVEHAEVDGVGMMNQRQLDEVFAAKGWSECSDQQAAELAYSAQLAAQAGGE